MKEKFPVLAIVLLSMLLINGCSVSQKTGSLVTSADYKKSVYYLASAELKGRYPGTPGSQMASEYIRKSFKKSGLTFPEGNGFQNFEVITHTKFGEENKIQIGGYKPTLKKDFIPLAYSSNDTANYPVVFAGFGFSINTDSLKWDDYKGLDVKNKCVLIFRGEPDFDKEKQMFSRYSSHRSKVLLAKEKGAKAVIFVSPVSLDKADNLLTIRGGVGSAGILVVHVKRSVADSIFKYVSTTLRAQEDAISNLRKPTSIEIPVNIKLRTEVTRVVAPTRNVIGILPGTDPVLKNEYIVIGGHYDHLGMGGHGSGSRKPDTTAIHYGADDNASGTAMVMGLAKRLAKQKSGLKRSVVFMAFDAEEEGLLGSKYFVNNPLVPLKNIKAMINLDMVGRLNAKKEFQLHGTGTALETDSLVKAHLKKYSLKPTFMPGGTGPSDHSSFYSKNIPVLFFITDLHVDYHTPFDTPDKINYEGMEEISNLVTDLAIELANRPKPLTFKETASTPSEGNSRSYKVSLGIMPDFASADNSGVRVDAVTKGRPAEKAGILKGDVIVGLNGAAIKNIEDYMFQLGKCNAGDKVKVEVKRNGNSQIVEVQL